MKRSSQINESKDSILKSFLSLLNKKEFDEITMSEIARNAQVVRMTVYRHFSSKSDILVYGASKLAKRLFESLNNMENPQLLDFLILKYTIIHESPYQELYIKLHRKSFDLDHIEFARVVNFLPHFSDVSERAFIRGGINTSTVTWIKNGMKESPEELAFKVNNMVLAIYNTNPSQVL